MPAPGWVEGSAEQGKVTLRAAGMWTRQMWLQAAQAHGVTDAYPYDYRISEDDVEEWVFYVEPEQA